MRDTPVLQSVLARATEAWFIRLGKGSELEVPALGQGHIPFTVWKLTDEEIRSATLNEMEALLKSRGEKTKRDATLINSIASASPLTLFWTVDSTDTIHWCCADNGPVEFGPDYRYRRASHGWFSVARPDGASATKADLPPGMLADAAKNSATHGTGRLELFRQFVSDSLRHSRPASDSAPAFGEPSSSLDDRSLWADSLATMLKNARAAVNRSGDLQLSVHKDKRFELGTDAEGQDFLWDLLRRQNGRCAITGITLVPGALASMAQMPLRPSLDRRASDGHYHPDNVQLVCQFVNFWKRATPDDDFVRLVELVRKSPGRASSEGLGSGPFVSPPSAQAADEEPLTGRAPNPSAGRKP